MKPTSLLDSGNKKTIFPLTVYRNSRHYYEKNRPNPYRHKKNG